jgi:Lon-like protease
MNRRTATMIVGAVLLAVMAVVALALPVPYVALGPGPTLDTLGNDSGGTEIIQVDGKTERRSTGHLNLTTVSVRDQLTLRTAFMDWIDGKHSVVPREEVYPPGQSQQDFDSQATQQFTQSQSSAEYAALGELGYPTQVIIDSLPDGSPSKGKLTPKDVLTSVNGTKVDGVESITKVLTALKPGAKVTVGYVRGAKEGSAEITTTKPADRQGAALGVLLTLQRKAPFTVKIGLDDSIGGPSAGLMFALGIVEKVGPEELTGGAFIAGTGEIDNDGNVAPIGGIQLKMIAAKDRGATVFLVPKDNCSDALAKHPDGLKLIKVDSLHSAIAALKAQKAGQPTPAC